MSGTEKLKEKIIAEAEAQAEKVLKEARARAADITGRAETEADERYANLLAQAQEQAQERKRRVLTIANLDARKQILAAKEEMIEDTFSQALARLQTISPESYREIIFSMILATAQNGDEELIISPEQQDAFDVPFLDRLNKALRKNGKKGEIALAAQTRPLKGGFVLSAGAVEINNSFNALLSMQRDQLEPAVAEMLFKE